MSNFMDGHKLLYKSITNSPQFLRPNSRFTDHPNCNSMNDIYLSGNFGDIVFTTTKIKLPGFQVQRK